ncbi:MAG: ABC transporter permease [Actinomycetota bacterium]
MRTEGREGLASEVFGAGEAGALQSAGAAVRGEERRRGGWLRRSLLLIGAPLATAAFVLGVWTFVSYVALTEGQRFLLPPPQQVLRDGFFNWEHLQVILLGTWATAKVALLGLTIAIGVGMLLAILMAQARWIERSIYPYAVIVQTIPIIALVPLVGFFFTYNFTSRVLACVLIAIFPIITNTLFGLRSADESLHDLFTLHGAGRLTRLWKLELPGALPAIFTGFRISAGLSVIGAIVGDFFFRVGEQGIGRLIDVYRAQLRAEEMFTAIFFSSLLGIVVFLAFGYLANRVTRSWHESAQERGK